MSGVRKSGNKGNKRVLSSPESNNPNALKRVNMTDKGKLDKILAGIETMQGTVESLSSRMTSVEESIKTSVAKLEKRFDEREKEWEKERAALTHTQIQLESRLDQLERREKRNSVVISGLNAVNRENAVVVVNGLFNGQGVTVEEASVFNAKGDRPKVVARFKNFDDKMKVLKAKKDLAMIDTLGNPVPVFVNDDLTRKDQHIQFRGRELAKEMRGLKKAVRVGYRKVSIDGEWHLWDEVEQNFVKSKN